MYSLGDLIIDILWFAPWLTGSGKSRRKRKGSSGPLPLRTLLLGLLVFTLIVFGLIWFGCSLYRFLEKI